MQTHVYIVLGGKDGRVLDSEHRELAGAIKVLLELTKRAKRLAIEIIPNSDETLDRAIRHRGSVIVFLTRHMIQKAREIKEKHPDIKVVVFTILMPRDEITIIGRIGLSKESLEHIILGV